MVTVKHAGRRTLRSVLQLLVREMADFHRVRSRRTSLKQLQLNNGGEDDDDDNDYGRRGSGPLLGHDALFRAMMFLNLLSLAFPFAPVLLGGAFGVDTYLSTKIAHASSTRPFGPPALVELAFDDGAPLQTMDVTLPERARGGKMERWLVEGGGQVGSKSSTTVGPSKWWFVRRRRERGHSSAGTTVSEAAAAVATVYLPGLALDCLLGVFQGLVLGLDLLSLYRRGRGRGSGGAANATENGSPQSIFPSLSLLLFAGMCASALPLHCLRGSPLVFEEDGNDELSLSKTALLFADVFCTTVAPTFMFLDLLVRTGRLNSGAQWMAAMAVPLIKAPLVWAGVSSRSERWGPALVAALHVGPLPFYGALFYFLLLEEVRRHRACPHEVLWMATSGVPVLVFSAGGALLGMTLATVTGGMFDTLTCAFLGCRIGMVQYWAYVRARDGVCRRCDCNNDSYGGAANSTGTEEDVDRKRD